MKDLHCFGTDREKALENALHTQFRSAVHLRCFLHFRGNLEAKLSDLGISKSDAQEFVRDVLGNFALLEDGLVDAECSEQFGNLKTTWDEREASLKHSSTAKPCFHRWFEKN